MRLVGLGAAEKIGKVNSTVFRLDNRITEEVARVDKNVDGLRVMVAELRSEMKSDIAAQTKWIFGAWPLVMKFLFFV